MARIQVVLFVLCFTAVTIAVAHADNQNLQLLPVKTMKIENAKHLDMKQNAKKYVPVKRPGSDSIKFIPENEVTPNDQPVTLMMLPGHAGDASQYVERIESLEEDLQLVREVVLSQSALIRQLTEKVEHFTSQLEEETQ